MMPTLPDLLRIPYVDPGLKYAISPDEKRIVFSWNKSGAWELWESKGSEIRELEIGLAGAKFSPQFSPDGTKIAFALDSDGSESYHICIHDFTTNTSTDLTPDILYAHQPNVSWSPDGNSLAVLSDAKGIFSLYVLPLDDSGARMIRNIFHPCWDVAWSPDGKWIAVESEAAASDRSIHIVPVGRHKGQVRTVQLTQNGKGLNAQHPAWSPDSRFLAFSCENSEWFNIGLFNIETQEVSWVTDSTGDDTQPAWSRSGEIIGWVHSEGARTNFQFKKGGDAIREVKVGEGVHAQPQITADGVVILFEDVNHPTDLWKIDLETGNAAQLTRSLEEELNFPQPEEIWYAGMDGVQVPALLYRGKGECAVLDIHGGPNWHLQFSWNPVLSLFASRGWTVLAPNYRGSTGYGKKWQNASRYDMGGVDNDDCAAGAKYLVENGLAKKIAVTGRSHGGYLTMTCLTGYPELFAGGSAVVPFLNWIKSHHESREDLKHWNIENMGDPEDNKELWIARSPYFFLDRVSAPVQLVCGENDPRCPASDSIDARDKLVELGKDVELLLYEGEGHAFYKIENIVDAEIKRVEFLEKVLTTDEKR
ncbi:MAG TPA: prolyl oligopeptidase family serine peptidase [Anaerolineales bacterium]|nr:prolyl oligopeptidase family serine peptidase [Anaerolineales bacterium]